MGSDDQQRPILLSLGIHTRNVSSTFLLRRSIYLYKLRWIGKSFVFSADAAQSSSLPFCWGYFSECRGYIVEGPYFTKGKPNYQIIIMKVNKENLHSNCASIILVFVAAGCSVVTQHGTFDIFFYMNVFISCLYAFLSRVRSDILRLAKKDALLHALVHLNVSKHISVCHKSFSYSGVRYILEAKKHQKNIRK